jgi:DNA invertase Pin-like site-specific DNA recombinase
LLIKGLAIASRGEGSSKKKMVRNYKRKTEDRWTKEDLLEALTSIKDDKLKINDAARQYSISRATLYRQFKKFLQAGGKCDVNQFKTCGGNAILTNVSSFYLFTCLKHCT